MKTKDAELKLDIKMIEEGLEPLEGLINALCIGALNAAADSDFEIHRVRVTHSMATIDFMVGIRTE